MKKVNLIILYIFFLSLSFTGGECDHEDNHVDPTSGHSGACIFYKTGKSSTWLTVNMTDYEYFSSIIMGYDNNFYITNNLVPVGVSSNSGANWSFSPLELGYYGESLSSYYINSPSNSIICAISRGSSHNNIYLSSDHGSSWINTASIGIGFYGSHIKFEQNSQGGFTGIATANGIYYSSDGGHNWSLARQTNGYPGDLAGYYRFPGEAEFVTKQSDSIYYSTSGGMNWNSGHGFLGNLALEFFNASTIIAAENAIYFTSNFGANWVNVTPTGSNFDVNPIVDLYTVSSGEVYALTKGGRIYANTYNNVSVWNQIETIQTGGIAIEVNSIWTNGYEFIVAGKFAE